MVLDDEEINDEELISFQRRKRSPLAQLDPQPGEIQSLFTEMEIVKNFESHFRDPIVVFGQRISTPDVIPA